MRRGGIGGLQVIPSPTGGLASSGGVSGMLVAQATITQNLTNGIAQIAFDTVAPGNFGYVNKVGNTFVFPVGGTILAIFEPQVRQLKNNNVTTFWAVKNGLAVPNTGVDYEAAAAGDNNVVSLTIGGIVAANDVLEFHGQCSLSLGANLQYTPPAAPVPGILACLLTLLTFRTGTTPTT